MSQEFENIPPEDIHIGTIVIHKQSGIPYRITEMKNDQVILTPDTINELVDSLNTKFGYINPTNMGGKRRNQKKKTKRIR